jgi:hypothetical protein
MVWVERGLKVFRHSLSCSVIGANAGDWLLSFSPKDWEDAKVLGSQSDPWLGLAGRSLRKLSFASTLDLVSAVQECDMVLGAGSIEQLTSLLALFRTTKPVLLVSQGHSARGLVGTKPFRLTHAAVGGVTTWSGKVWTRCWNMGPWPRTVRRDIGHVLIHLDMPRACQPNPTLNRLNFCPWMARTCPWSFTCTPRAQIGVLESSLTRKRRTLWMCPSDSLMTALASLCGLRGTRQAWCSLSSLCKWRHSFSFKPSGALTRVRMTPSSLRMNVPLS